jgi:Flp pilus assembly pilin Flp
MLANGYNFLYGWSTGRELDTSSHRFSSLVQQFCARWVVWPLRVQETDMLTNAMQLVRASLRSRAGVSSIEYGILAVGIIAAVTAAMTVFSTVLSDAFADLGTLIKTAF